VILGGLQAGPVVAQIVGVGAKQDFVHPQTLGQRLGQVEQLVLAVVAAVFGIHAEFGRDSSCDSVTSVRAPICAASSSAALRSLAAMVGDSATMATHRSPSTSCATLSSRVESTPPE
jgi:hypothetical protein